MGRRSELGLLTLDELIDALGEMRASGVPGVAAVILAKDSEGNGFSPVAAGFDAEEMRELDCSIGWYRPESTWSGEFWTAGDVDADPEDDHPEPGPDDIPAVCLWPTN